MTEPEYILRENGEPFADMRSANRQKTILERQGVITEPRELDDDAGFALEVIQRRRPERVPLHSRSVWAPRGKNPNFEYRGVNDNPNRPGRIGMFEDAGWEVVTGDDKASDPRVGQTSTPGAAVTVPGGNGITMVLMRKRKDWFDEDYAVKMAKITEDEKALVQKAQMDNLHAASGYQQGISITGQGKR